MGHTHGHSTVNGNPERLRYRTAMATLSVVTSVVLMAVKLVAYQLTGSVVVLSDALEGVVNIVAGVFGLVAVRVADLPADENHPYGHGKVEFIAAALEGGMILAAAALIAYTASVDFLDKPEVTRPGLGTAIVLAAAAVNGIVGLLLVRAGRETHSPALVSDGHHLLTDLMTSVFAAVALVLVAVTHRPIIDPILGLVAAGWIGRMGFKLVRTAIAGVMDEADPEDLEVLRQALDDLEEPLLLGYRELRSRHQGALHRVEVSLLVSADVSVGAGAGIAGRISRKLEDALGLASVTCRVEPASKDSGNGDAGES